MTRNKTTTVGDLLTKAELEQLLIDSDQDNEDGTDTPEPDVLPHNREEASSVLVTGRRRPSSLMACLRLAGSVLMFTGAFGVALAASPNPDLRETSFVLVTAIGTLLGLRSATSRRHPTPELQAAPLVREAKNSDDALYLEAVSLCQQSDYKAAEQHWRALASDGHTASIYALALLYSVVDTKHAAALEAFQLLQLTSLSAPVADVEDDRYETRSSLGVALLGIETDFNLSRLAQQLEAASHQDPRGNHAERRAQQLATGLLVELRAIQSSGVVEGSSDSEIPDELRSEFRHAMELVHRASDRPTRRRSLKQQLASTISRAVALTLPLTVAGHRTLRILPVDLVPKRRTGDRVAWFRRSVPVLHSDHPETDPYGSTPVTRVSRWLILHGIRGLTPAFASLASTVGAAICVATGELRWAAVMLSLGALMDCVDGRVVQLSSSYIRVDLFLDYLFDRLGDIALGFGYLIYFHTTSQDFAHTLIANGFLTVCLLSSYIRAEGSRFGLDGSGGLFERPHRTVLLVCGLVFLRPVYSLYGVTILSGITLLERGLQALGSVRADSVAELGLRAATVPYRPAKDRKMENHASSIG